MINELEWMPAHKVRDLIAKKEFSPVEVVQQTLERIEDLDPQINAYITVCADEAIDQARDAEAAVQSGQSLGPLHGVPVSVKDEAWVKGVRATGGSLLFENFVPSEDGTCARRLREAGAIIVGKTNVPEFMSWSRTANRLMPETVNPWDLGRCSGASSGGSAASIAAGFTAIAIGSDGGGSVRIPSAACGIVGLFPTPGRIPDTGSFSYSYFGSLGPMARDVRDVGLLMEVLAGPDGMDNRIIDAPPDCLAKLDGGVSGMRFAWTSDFGYINVQPGLAKIVRDSLNGLESQGAEIDEPGIQFENAWEWLGAQIRGHARYSGLVQPLTTTDHFYEFCLQPENFERLTEYGQNGAKAPRVSQEEYEVAVKRTEKLKKQFDALFANFDAVISPTLPVVAPILPDDLSDPYPEFCCGTYFTAVANLAELPAATYPCGFLDGLPVGLQIIGKRGREDTVLQICRALEKTLPVRHPTLNLG